MVVIEWVRDASELFSIFWSLSEISCTECCRFLVISLFWLQGAGLICKISKRDNSSKNTIQGEHKAIKG